MASERIQELDSLRAIAAISVMLFHFTYGYNHNDTNYLFHKGFMGVELFFVISGFVIFMTLQNTKTTGQFAVSRFARLYPAYWFSVLLSFVLFSIPFIFNNQIQPSFHVSEIFIPQFLINLTMFQSYFGIEHIDGAYWTLSVELFFYIVMLIVFASKKMKYIEIVGWIYILLLFIDHRFLKIAHLDYMRYGLYFLVGILYYNIYKEGLQWKKVSQYFLIFVTLYLNLHYFYHDNIERSIVVLIYGVFALLSFHKLEWFRFPIFVFLGQISYSTYLLHENIGSICFNILSLIGIENLWVKILITAFVVIMLAYFSFRLFENIVRKQIIKITRKQIIFYR